MKPKNYILHIVVNLFLLGCSEEGMMPATPQKGELVGEWNYIGTSYAEPGLVWRCSFCDETWWVQPVTVFQSDGFVNSVSQSKCAFQIKDSNHFDVDCSGRGRCSETLRFTVENDELRIWFKEPKLGGQWEKQEIANPVVFKRKLG